MSEETQEILAARVNPHRKARQAAQALAALIEAELATLPASARQVLASGVYAAIDRHLPGARCGAGPKPMDDAEARRFGQETMPFGKFAGTKMDEVPLDYLEWYADQPLQRQLIRYLKSRRIREERD